ncbi:hypothetical protein BKA70DRAFT_1535573 [Coprinopsis sp. MPI-PUGE-AT-0042]|nr:hypothetical protein BKA70DRAFT_1535573 [Coprinopsis sp. MPI-PUGE-AT-0042]
MSQHSSKMTEAFRKAGWRPANDAVPDQWLKEKVELSTIPMGAMSDLHPVLEEFKTMIENDGDMFMGFNHMFENGIRPIGHQRQFVRLDSSELNPIASISGEDIHHISSPPFHKRASRHSTGRPSWKDP